MATLALPPPPPPAIIVREKGPAEGPEGKYLREKTESILRHWNEPVAPTLESTSEEEELSYRSVPLEPAFSVRVRYQYRGELKPRRLASDE